MHIPRVRLSAAAIGIWLLAGLSQAARIPSRTVLQLAQNARDLNAPAAFKVQIYPTAETPLDSESIYRTATEMMYRITAHRLAETWLDREWHSPDNTVNIFIKHHGYGKDPSRLNMQHLIRALNHLLQYIQLQNQFCQTTAVISWLGTTIGTIDIWPSAPPRGLETHSTNTTTITTDTTLTARDTANNTLGFTTFEVTIAYGDQPIPKNLLYLTAIKAMGQAAERGITANIEGITTQGIQGVTWKLVPSSGRSSMEAGWSKEAVVRTLASAITDQWFAETFVWVHVDGMPVAIGRFTKA